MKIGKNSVLIVDDEGSNIMTLTHILSERYTVYAATNGKDALDAAHKYMPDVILLDVIMPDMDGYDVIRELKRNDSTRGIPVIFITGLIDAEDEERGMALGAADYIPKPFSPTLVKLRVSNQVKLVEQFRSNEYDIMKYKLSNDALNIALWDMDVISEDPTNPNNRFTWSQEVRHMLGFADQQDFPDLLHSWSDRLHPEEKERVLEAFAAHLNDRTGRTPYDIEFRLRLKNGQYRTFHALGTTYRDNTGSPVRTAGALRDIHDRKLMEQEIAAAMEKIEEDAHWYKSILDAIPLPVNVIDADMKWKFVNKSVENFLGSKLEDMLGKHCSNWGAHICNTDDCGAACARRGLKRTFFSDGDSSYQVDVEVLLDMEGETAGFIEVVQDITNVQRLAKQRAEAEVVSRSKTAFLANMSHEIRTPMNAIWGITEILMQNDELPQSAKEGLGRIHSSCNMLLGIINDILDFSKIEAGKLDIMPADYDLASMINDSIQLNIMRAGDKPITFNVRIDEHIPAKLVGDELRIKQILNNLLSNAFKYTDSGTVTLYVSSEPRMDGVALVASVQDTGHGMTQEQIGKLFDEYSRFNEEGGQAIEGTGLGMAITHRLLALMNGQIHVESEPGRGSLFTVRIPQGVADREMLGRELTESLQQLRPRFMTSGKKSQIIRDSMPYGKVLIVDDVETNLYVAEGLMKPYELQIETAVSGFDAISMIKAGKSYDIVFMDHMMPKMDGIEAAKRIRGLGYDRPIVALTANAVVGQSEIFLQNGFDAFISKPIDIRNLNSVLNKYVRDKHKAEGTDSDTGGRLHTDPALLKSFEGDARKALTVMEGFSQTDMGEGAVEELTGAAHAVKSALANIGESGLSATAQKLETAGGEKDRGQIDAILPGLITGLSELLSRLNGRPLDEDGEDRDIGWLVGRLAAVREMCAAYNRKGALDALEEIGQAGCSGTTRAAIDGITGLVLQAEFEEAEKAAASYAGGLAPDNGEDTTGGLASKYTVDGLDIEKGIERYHGDEEIYLKILRSYVASVRSLLGTIEEADAQSLPSYEITVHGIKGVSRDIFAGPVGESAWELEKAAKAGDLGYIGEHNPAFLEAAWKLIKALEGMLADIDDGHPKPLKDTPDESALRELRVACEDYDLNAVEAAMAKIDAYKYTSDGGLALWLRENADLMNFLQIAERLEDI